MQTEAFKPWRARDQEAGGAGAEHDASLEQVLDALDAHIGSMAEHLERVLVEEVRAAVTTHAEPGDPSQPEPYRLAEIDERTRSLAYFAFRDEERSERFLARAGQEEIDLLEAWYSSATRGRPPFRARARHFLRRR